MTQALNQPTPDDGDELGDRRVVEHDRRAAEPPVDQLYNRYRRILLDGADVLPRALPVDAQAVITLLAFKGDDQHENGFRQIITAARDLSYERGWMAHEMFAPRIDEARRPNTGEHLAIVEGGQAS